MRVKKADANYNVGPRPSSSGYVAGSSRTRQKRPSGDTENGPSKKRKPCAAELPFLRRLNKKLAPGSRPRLHVKSVANAVRDPKEPSFKPSLLGPPFYPGRTMYGGAASSYINQPNIKQESVAVVNETKSNDDLAIINSPRRVLVVLERYSPPLKETRKIALFTKPKNESPHASKIISHKTQELQLIASHSSTSGYPMNPDEAKGKEPEKEQPNKMTTKVKSRLTRADRRNIEEVDAPTPVELSMGGLQLDQDNLSKLSFGTPALKLRATSTPKTTVDLFKYSNPEIVSGDPLQVCLGVTPPKYTFKSPENTTVSKDWQCSDCWVKIKPEANNCTVPLTDISKTDADWKCEDCWISNKSTVDKCAACGGARLGVKQNNPANVTYKTSSFLGSSDDKFKTFILSQKSNKWECSSCLVNNESDKDKCVCCGAAKESKNKTPGPKFNFGTVANSSFKFKVIVEDPEATIDQKLEVNSTIESKAKQQSGTNNVLAETPTFTFTLPTKQVDVKADDYKGQSNKAKINLTFVIPKEIPTDTDTKDPASFLVSVPVGIAFYFGENAQVVPSVDLNSVVINNENKTLPPAVNSLNPLAADAKKDLKVNSVPSPVVPDAEKPKPTLSFGVNAPKLFKAPSSTASTMNLLTQQTQSTTETTTSAPTLPLFKPPAATTVSNPSIPSFEAPSLTQPAVPASNFDTPQSTSIFGFRQQAPLQQQQMQPEPLQSQQPGGRRVRKAFRRIPQR